MSENAFINSVSPSAFYGRGIFTTVAIFDSQPFLWIKHWQRIAGSSRKIKLDLAQFTETKVLDALYRIITENKIINGRARLTFFDESSISIWQIKHKQKISFLINTADFRKISEQFCLTTSTFRTNSTSPLSGVKSCNYLENILALEDSKVRAFDEAVRLNERDEIVSGCMANVFWLKNDEIFTPHLETGCLAGTTREFILENYSVREVKTDLAELNKAEAIFLTSAGIGIAQAVEFQGRKLSRETHELIKIVRAK